MAAMSSVKIKPAEPLTMYEIVFPGDLNANGTMFGGKVVAMMDICAGLCASRWSNRPVVTASIDAIQFCQPLRQGQMVECRAEVAYVGRTSCVVRVRVTGEDLSNGDRFHCCAGWFNMVGMDAHGRPVPLPQIPVEDEAAKTLWEQGKEIKEAMLARRGRPGDVTP
jgi:acyl-CoA hydrolase